MKEFLQIWLDIFYAGWEARASEKQKGKGNEAYQAYQQIRNIEEKPKATRGLVEKWLEEKWCEDWCDPGYYKVLVSWLIDLLKEAGVEMEK